MESYLLPITFWHWIILAVVLLFFEIFAPGAIFLWIAIAAAVVGLVLLAVPDILWEYQVILFAVLSVVSLVGGRLWLKKNPTKSDQPDLNRRGSQYVGRHYTLEEAVTNGAGKLKVDDTYWKISGVDMPAGTVVKVTDIDGVVLRVIAAEAREKESSGEAQKTGDESGENQL